MALPLVADGAEAGGWRIRCPAPWISDADQEPATSAPITGGFRDSQAVLTVSRIGRPHQRLLDGGASAGPVARPGQRRGRQAGTDRACRTVVARVNGESINAIDLQDAVAQLESRAGRTVPPGAA